MQGGIFDEGWDGEQGTTYSTPKRFLVKFNEEAFGPLSQFGVNHSPDCLEGHGFGRVEELSQGVVWREAKEADQYMINRRTGIPEERPEWVGDSEKKGVQGLGRTATWMPIAWPILT